jgi:hypothetical protein
VFGLSFALQVFKRQKQLYPTRSERGMSVGKVTERENWENSMERVIACRAFTLSDRKRNPCCRSAYF